MFKNKVAVVTGAGGVLCSMFATALAKTGAKIALLDLNEQAAKDYADAIVKDGGIAKGYACNVLDKASIEEAHKQVVADFGTCDILINGAGGNNPKATTDNEYFNPDDVGKMKTFFDLDQSGVAHTGVCTGYAYKGRCKHHQYFQYECIYTAY